MTYYFHDQFHIHIYSVWEPQWNLVKSNEITFIHIPNNNDVLTSIIYRNKFHHHCFNFFSVIVT